MTNLEKRSLLKDDGVEVDEQQDFEPQYGHHYQALDTGHSVNGVLGRYEPMDEINMEIKKKKGVTLAWQDIQVTCPQKNVGLFKKKTVPAAKLLHGVSGVAEPGNMIAIMGASGSGKTTFLNVLTGRVGQELDVQGSVLLNGRPAGDQLEMVSGYIQQEDLFIGTLTIREHLWFTAKLRMPRGTSDSERTSRVDESIQELGLTRSQNTLIGIPGFLKGISGGEKKRLALAAELLNNPKIMFADEPTSGLDSFMAASVVECLINLANRGRTVLCTIHQPSSDVYAMFPQIMLLSEGKTVYFGATVQLPSFFAECGMSIPSGYNPADFFIKNLAIIPGKEKECRQRVEMLIEAYADSPQFRKIHYHLEQNTRKDDFIMEMDKVYKKGKQDDPPPKYQTWLSQEDSEPGAGGMGRYSADFTMQFSMLYWRCLRSLTRNKKIVPARIIQIIFTGFLLGLVFYQQIYNQTGISNINGAVFMLLIQVSFNTCFTIAVAFIADHAVFLKEHRDRTYCVLAYYLAKVLCDLPPLIFACLLYSTITYWMIGFNPDPYAYLLFSLGVSMMAMAAVGMGHMAAALLPNPQLCMTLAPLMLGIFLTFAGFLVREDTLLPIFLPLLYLSPYRYTYTGLLIVQWRDIDYISCTYSTDYEDWFDAYNATTSTSGCLTNGYEVLRDYGYNPGDVRFDFWVVVAFFFAVEIIGYLVLWRRGSQRRK